MGYKSPHIINIPLAFASSDLADSTVLYFGMVGAPMSATEGQTDIAFHRPGIIRGVVLTTFSVGGAGTNEDIEMYVRLNATSDTLIQIVGTAAVERQFINRNLNIPVTITDSIQIKFVPPIWVTNPLQMRGGGYLTIECE